ncbi:DNA mismatch repair protein [Linnemannia elongata]|nr:DNA mismatch repair protein [Linnemannia elongata]
MASIQPLASSVSDELRASLVVNSLEQCISELIQNSIDANATSIEVKVDVAGHSLQVSDNGDGMLPADMALIGARYATSKCFSLQDLNRITTYGFRGEAVAAITDMSLVDIVSRPRGHEHVYSTIFKGGDKLFCGPSSKYPRFTHGTTISVRDLFYKFPVRQRYWSDASASKLEVELERAKRMVETLALVTPWISFTLIDMAKDAKIMTCRKVDSHLHRITTILGQALSTSLSFVKSSAEDPVYTFSGYISTQGHYNRLCQYIFLNQRPVQCEKLQRLVTHLFQQSSFAADSLVYAQDARRSRERHPIFIFMLTCPTSEYDLCADPSKVTIQFENEERAFQVVRSTIIDFLERHHLLSRTAATALRYQSGTKKRKQHGLTSMDAPTGLTPLDYISRVKESQPSRASRLARQIQTYENAVGEAYQSEIDIEDDLEFELDADWMAFMLDSVVAAYGALWIKTFYYWHISDLGSRCAPKVGQPGPTNRPYPSSMFKIPAKFILCTMEPFSAAMAVPECRQEPTQHGLVNKVLVVIDQHAADERVRVESLMKEMCTCSHSAPKRQDDYETTIITHQLDSMTMIPRLPITLTRREWHLAEQATEWLSRWGIVLEESSLQDSYDSLDDGSEAETVMVSQHFTQDDGNVGTTSAGGCPTVRTRPMTGLGHNVESDYRQGRVVSLPRIVADRCVVDSALTQDLIKDTLSSFEEGRYRSRRLLSGVEQGMSDDF